MAITLNRRDFVAGSALLAGAAALALGPVRVRAAPLVAPEIDRLTIRVVVDSGHELYLDKTDHPMVKVERSGIGIIGGSNTLAGINSQWGLSLYIETSAGGVTRRQMLDFGLTPDLLVNNAKLLGVDPARLDGLILSHGHGDHYGGLVGFLETHRSALRPDIALVVGGEDNFCWQYSKSPDGKFAEFGVLDRADLKRLAVAWSVAEEPRLIGDQAFSTGRIARESFEKVLPNTFVEYGTHNGIGCDAGHFTAAERCGEIVPNQHWNEHATCFNLRGRGLVVISSCGHAGIINSVRAAQKATGIAKVHAIIGGFHLYPAQAAYVAEIVQGIKALEPDLVIPMHCSGVNFVAATHEMMPDQLVTSTTGNRFTLGA
jgi:7,8-dihydropterin-6-yl-methyl-4-(beta-D-ribofuranosyl)aminobenzene 5'-phosphate synthase